MAFSSILGGDRAPAHPNGKGADMLGPSDSSDSGSDSIGELGEDDLNSDSDRSGTGDRAAVEPQTGVSGADILPDRVIDLEGDDVGTADDLLDAADLENLDGDAADTADGGDGE